MHQPSFLHTALAASLLCLSQLALATEASVDIARIEAAISRLEVNYGDVTSDIDCKTATLTSHRLICDATGELAQMLHLDRMAAVYAYENAHRREVNHEQPPIDEAFVATRNACNDTDCLRNALIAHTNDSLGGESPY